LGDATKRMKKRGSENETKHPLVSFRSAPFLDEEMPSYSSKRLVKADGNN
jgi:hypothetical protein